MYLNGVIICVIIPVIEIDEKYLLLTLTKTLSYSINYGYDS